MERMDCWLFGYSYNTKNEKVIDSLWGSPQDLMEKLVAKFQSAENQTIMIFKHEGRLIYVPCRM